MDEWFRENIRYNYDDNNGFDYYYITKTIENLFELYYIHKTNGILNEEQELYSHPKDLMEILQKLGEEYLMFVDIPNKEAIKYNSKYLNEIEKSIDRIKSVPEQKQRSKEWFEFRKKNFTASDFYKIFSDKTLSSMIKKKLHPIITQTKPSGAMKKGIIFEDVAVSIYEDKFGCKVNEFGCIPHKSISGLAASPDGIVIEKGDKYGRMLEIKCVSSRVLNGIVPEPYWMQMQVQMECCDLELCDFLECLFLEKPSYDEWLEYLNKNTRHKYYGILIEGYQNGSLKYLYGKLNSKKYPEYPVGFVPDTIHYWYLNTLSLKTIKRNREWFALIEPRVHEAIKKLNEEYNKNNQQLPIDLHTNTTISKKSVVCMFDSDDD